jgi:citrate synthase
MRFAADRSSRSRGWITSITRIEPDRVEVVGRPIGDLVGRRTFPEVAHLLIQRAFPDAQRCREMKRLSFLGASLPLPCVTRFPGEHVAKTLAKHLLADEEIVKGPAGQADGECSKTAFCVGRVLRAVGSILGTGPASEHADPEEPFSHRLYRTFTGESRVREEQASMLEAIVVACIDHGVTPPSTQACILAASARAPYEVAVALGVGSISDLHGGASGRAAEFFVRFQEQKKRKALEPFQVLDLLIGEVLGQGKKIPGLGHRIHTADPRCEALWRVSEETGVAAECVQASRLAPQVFEGLHGRALPMNVDGLIGAIVADMGFRPIVATLAFILGRVAGLSAHYFEEVGSFPAMRWIDFDEAVYKGE